MVEFETLLTPAETARALRVDVKTVARWRQLGRLRAVRMPSGRYRYRTSDIQAILDGTGGAA